MTKEDVNAVIKQMRVIHEEQTRRLIEQVLELRHIEDRLKEEPIVEEDTVDAFANMLKAFK
jgi:hypothetical protein